MAGKRSHTDDDTNDHSTPRQTTPNTRRIRAMRPPTSTETNSSAFSGRFLTSGSVKPPHNNTKEEEDKIRDFSIELFRLHGTNHSGADLSSVVDQLIQENRRLARTQNPSFPYDGPVTSYVTKEAWEKSRNFTSVAAPRETPASSTTATFAAASTQQTGAASGSSTGFSFGAPAPASTPAAFSQAPTVNPPASSGFSFQPSAAAPVSTSGFAFQPKSTTAPPPASGGFSTQPSTTATPPAETKPEETAGEQDLDEPLEVQALVEEGWKVVTTFENVQVRRLTDGMKWIRVFQGNLDVQTETTSKKTRLLMKNMHDTYFNLVPSVKPTLKESAKEKKTDFIFVKGYNAVEEEKTKGDGTFMITIRKAQSKELFAVIEKAVGGK